MDMGFDTRIGRADAADQPFGAPEWLAMRARLGAQWLARRTLSRAADGGDAATGCFNSPAVCALAAYANGTRPVNRTALANRKPIGAIDDAAAGAQPTGGRGL
jgi:hypothetical protein